MTTQSLSHNGQIIPIKIKRSLRAKDIRLTLNIRKKELILTLPPFTLKRAGESFLKQKESWIKKQWDQLEKHEEKFPKHSYQNGDYFWYLGEQLTLEIKINPRALDKRFAKRSGKIVGDTLEIHLPPNLTTNQQKEKVKEAIEQFYKKKASEVIHDRLEFLNQHYQFNYQRVSFRNQKTRWGSCSSKGNLNFNWRLVMAPIEIIDYVIIHELCHLKQMNHSKQFWELVSQKAPDHKKHRKWLRENGGKLKM